MRRLAEGVPPHRHALRETGRSFSWDVSACNDPAISQTTVFRQSLEALPLPRTQQLTITGSGFLSSSTLEFDDGLREYQSDPLRLAYVNSTTLRYDIALGVNAATWTVRVLNGAVSS